MYNANIYSGLQICFLQISVWTNKHQVLLAQDLQKSTAEMSADFLQVHEHHQGVWRLLIGVVLDKSRVHHGLGLIHQGCSVCGHCHLLLGMIIFLRVSALGHGWRYWVTPRRLLPSFLSKVLDSPLSPEGRSGDSVVEYRTVFSLSLGGQLSQEWRGGHQPHQPGPSLAPSTSSLPRDTQPSWPWALLGLHDQSSAYLITVLGPLLVMGLLFSPGTQGLAPRQWEMAPAHSPGTSDLAPAPGPLEVSLAERTMRTEAPSCAVTAAGGHLCKPALWCKNYLGIKNTSPLLTTWEPHCTARVCESGVDLLQTHGTNPHVQLDNHLSSTLPPIEHQVQGSLTCCSL